MKKELIAPCGMNCNLCKFYLREKNTCPGCKENCRKCAIKSCQQRKGTWCFECEKFPCDRLKRLDKRYKTKYEMSEIDNLNYIKDNGLDSFVKKEREKWVNFEGIYCVHDKKRYPKKELE